MLLYCRKLLITIQPQKGLEIKMTKTVFIKPEKLPLNIRLSEEMTAIIIIILELSYVLCMKSSRHRK